MKMTGNAHSVRLVMATATALSVILSGWTSGREMGDANAVRMLPIEVELPKPQFYGTPKNWRATHVKPVQTEAGPPFLAPEGTRNVALGRPVSSSDPEPVIGEPAMITDGDKEAANGSFVELGPFLHHVTIDLGARHDIYGLRLWHFHQEPRVYFDVVAQIADDPNFATGVKTVFNNDMDNSAGFGVGEDMHYVETHFGEIIDARGVQGRYVRLYSNGSTADDLNHYIEVEVYGKPAREEPTLVPLKIDYPRPMWIGSVHGGGISDLELPRYQAPPPPLVPPGTGNVAQGKSVFSSDSNPLVGRLARVTDGNKQASDRAYVELGPGLQHVTIDLGAQHEVYAVAIWHDHRAPSVYFDVILRISEGPPDSQRWTTYYNSDLDNTAGLGAGQDQRYVETCFGKLIETRGARGRYIRLYSNGNSMNVLNHYTEVEVYGRPDASVAAETEDETAANRE